MRAAITLSSSKGAAGPMLVLALSFAIPPCALAEEPPAPAAPERREAVDSDQDGRPEEWKVFQGPTLVRVERDRDEDGKVEVWIHLEGGKTARSEVDRNGDGRPDLIRFSKEGKPEREQADLNFDGRLDAWTYYKEGVKDLMIMDKNHDGRPDAWFYYGQGGFQLIGGRVDEDFDGKVDRAFGSAPKEETRQAW